MKPDAVAAPAAPHDKAHDTRVAAKQLEAFFLRQLLAEARPEGVLDGGFAGDTFKQMFNEALADKMTAAGGIGMANMFAKQLGGSEDLAHAASPVASPLAHAAPVIDAGFAPDAPGAPHFVLPVAGRPSSGYGMRADPLHGEMINHPGFDLAAKVGTEVSAAAAGTVVHAGPAGTYGNLVTVRHSDGFETRYAHLSAVDVQVGDTVQAGQDIGKVGTTGYSTGPHLHFEIRHEGTPIDPAPFLPLNRSTARTTR